MVSWVTNTKTDPDYHAQEMELREYVFDEEEVLKSSEVYESEYAVSDSQKGTLACTPKRVVYISGNTATDISLKAVHAIEYSAPGIPWGAVLAGGLLSVIGLAFSEIGGGLVGSPNTSLVSGAFIILGIGVVVAGFLLRRHVLKIHIPGQSFNFASRDNLENMAHLIRGQEAK